MLEIAFNIENPSMPVCNVVNCYNEIKHGVR